MYFNPRKLRGRQMKWVRQYEGPFLIVNMPSTLPAKTQRTPKARPKTVHIDKLEKFVGTPLRSRIDDVTRCTEADEASSPAEQLMYASPSPEAKGRRSQRRGYERSPRFELDESISLSADAHSSRPGPDEAAVTLGGRPKIVRHDSSISEAA